MAKNPSVAPRLIITSTDVEAQRLAGALDRAVYLPSPACEPFDETEPAPAIFAQRMRAIAAIDAGDATTLVCSPRALIRRVPSAGIAADGELLKTGARAELPELAERFERLGYRPVERISTPGTFALAGATLDLWPAGDEKPVRIRGKKSIEAVCRVEPETLRSCDDDIPELFVGRAGVGDAENAGERRTVRECLPDAEILASEDTLRALRHAIEEIDAEETSRRERGEPIASRAEWLRMDDLKDLAPNGPVPEADVTHSDAHPVGDTDVSLSERLHLGDLVVHLHHGIGRLDGLEDDPVGNGEMLSITFADGKLHVPAAEADLVWRYGPRTQGDDGRIGKMKSNDWVERLATMNEAVTEATNGFEKRREEHAKRKAKSLAWDADPVRELARNWYPLTPDQQAALDAIECDTTAEQGTVRPPMDRLLCGDTGYGKTEVLLRAAAAAVCAGAQAVVAAPTHLLTAQHCETFTDRLQPLGIEVRCLTGTTDEDDASETLERLRSGEPMVVVGTHRLAGDEIEFGDAALLVIDEEQRFGADIKHTLREKVGDAHVLATTATPIPRTTAAAIIGLRAISTLRRPPAGRRPVRTQAPEWNADALRAAILAEREAGGRTFVIVSRIADIDGVANELRSLVPDLRMARVHGKMNEDDAEQELQNFRDGKVDALLATTMIETGIDVPAANLIVVLDAARLGLAQLHQLRGRVGRGNRRGRAMLFTDCAWIDGDGDDEARARVETLVQHAGIGAGFDIAADDLAQRGAGDLFGEQQRGHLADVGLELFAHLFRDTMSGSGRAMQQLGTSRVSTPGARLPADYIPNETVRARLYARIAKATEADELDEIADELADRFGALPEPAKRLLDDAHMTLRLRADGVREIDFGPRGVAATFDPERASELRDELATNAIKWKGDRAVLSGDDIGPAELLKEIEAAR